MAGKGGVEGAALRTSRAILEELAPLIRIGSAGPATVASGPDFDRLATEILTRTRRMARRP